MRKCPKCQVVYHSRKRLTCLYCDSHLIAAEADEVFRDKSKPALPFHRGMLNEPMDLFRMQYILGGYFRMRSFAFIYTFCRNQLKAGKEFKRFFIEPFTISMIIKIPWLIINLIDSVIFHQIYKEYCPQCHWKTKKIFRESVHTKEQCVYNKEYSLLLKEILSGEIVKNEEKFERMAIEKQKIGFRSAYHDLCSRKQSIESGMDLATILLSMALIITIITKKAMEIIGEFVVF